MLAADLQGQVVAAAEQARLHPPQPQHAGDQGLLDATVAPVLQQFREGVGAARAAACRAKSTGLRLSGSTRLKSQSSRPGRDRGYPGRSGAAGIGRGHSGPRPASVAPPRCPATGAGPGPAARAGAVPDSRRRRARSLRRARSSACAAWLRARPCIAIRASARGTLGPGRRRRKARRAANCRAGPGTGSARRRDSAPALGEVAAQRRGQACQCSTLRANQGASSLSAARRARASSPRLWSWLAVASRARGLARRLASQAAWNSSAEAAKRCGSKPTSLRESRAAER